MGESEEFRRGIALFNSGRFFESHEVWEESWLQALEPEKTFLQGLIQVAAAFHHRGRGNMRGLKSLLAAGLAKLDQFPEAHRGIGLGKLRDDARKWMEGGADPRSLPRIKFTTGVSSKARPPGD
jgi:predicted metal-dependent hydrolase